MSHKLILIESWSTIKRLLVRVYLVRKKIAMMVKKVAPRIQAVGGIVSPYMTSGNAGPVAPRLASSQRAQLFIRVMRAPPLVTSARTPL